MGIPINNAGNCFTSQAGCRLKLEIDLDYGEKGCDNFCTHVFVEWSKIYTSMPKALSGIANNSWVSTK